MSNLNKLKFSALNLSGFNNLSWALDARIFLRSKGLNETVQKDNTETSVHRFQALFILRHHLAEDLKSEYLTIDNPETLWTNLKERFDHQKSIILPKARNDWISLRFQDFPSVASFNSALFKIVSQLRLCGDTVPVDVRQNPVDFPRQPRYPPTSVPGAQVHTILGTYIDAPGDRATLRPTPPQSRTLSRLERGAGGGFILPRSASTATVVEEPRLTLQDLVVQLVASLMGLTLKVGQVPGRRPVGLRMRIARFQRLVFAGIFMVMVFGQRTVAWFFFFILAIMMLAIEFVEEGPAAGAAPNREHTL